MKTTAPSDADKQSAKTAYLTYIHTLLENNKKNSITACVEPKYSADGYSQQGVH